MKSFVCIGLFAAAIISVAVANPAGGASSGTAAAAAAHEAEAEQNAQPAYDLTRFRKAAYGSGATISAPPCPKNYLFSCQPNVAPVACAAPAAQSYGSAGAYSAPIPYIAPVPAGFGGVNYGGYGPVAYNPTSQYYPY